MLARVSTSQVVRRRWWLVVAIGVVLSALAVTATVRRSSTSTVQPHRPECQPWREGATCHGWTLQYTGFGSAATTDGSNPRITLAPMPSTRNLETHAGLVVRRGQMPLDITVQMKTTHQLRQPNPNSWEVSWLLWDYIDDRHFYAVALKPNGWEVTKEDPAYPGDQRMLVTESSPSFPIGIDHHVRVRQEGNKFSVWVDGGRLMDFTDTERPYLAGSVGLYTEDAVVEFFDLNVP